MKVKRRPQTDDRRPKTDVGKNRPRQINHPRTLRSLWEKIFNPISYIWAFWFVGGTHNKSEKVAVNYETPFAKLKAPTLLQWPNKTNPAPLKRYWCRCKAGARTTTTRTTTKTTTTTTKPITMGRAPWSSGRKLDSKGCVTRVEGLNHDHGEVVIFDRRTFTSKC